jgi:hypothetical protein
MLRCDKNKIQQVRLRRAGAGGLSRATRIPHKKCWPSVLAMCLTAYASPLWAVDESPSGGADKLADDNEVATPVARLWRSLSLSYGSTRHHYREPDPLGRVDPLDSETGFIPTTQATLRWRGKLAQVLPEIAVQAQASYAQGQTDYNGYLQSGITLTPYSARTGNTLQAYNLRVGLPLNAFTRQPWAQQSRRMQSKAGTTGSAISRNTARLLLGKPPPSA